MCKQEDWCLLSLSGAEWGLRSSRTSLSPEKTTLQNLRCCQRHGVITSAEGLFLQLSGRLSAPEGIPPPPACHHCGKIIDSLLTMPIW